MSRVRQLAGILGLTVLATAPLTAQTSLVIHTRGGGINDISNYVNHSNGNTIDTGVGYSLGGGVAWQVNQYLALRGDFSYASSELQNFGRATGTDLRRTFYTGAIQLQTVVSAWKPFGYLGLGLARASTEPGNAPTHSSLTGVGGAGVAYNVIRGRPWWVFLESASYLYRVKDLDGPLTGMDENQFDVTLALGISYSVPF